MWNQTNVIGTPQPGVGAPRPPYRVECNACPDYASGPHDDLADAVAAKRGHIRFEHAEAGYRVLLSSASLTHSPELFEPGVYATRMEASAKAADLRRAQPGVYAWALAADADPAAFLATWRARMGLTA